VKYQSAPSPPTLWPYLLLDDRLLDVAVALVGDRKRLGGSRAGIG
jgi:hypothetical protein